MINNSDHLLSVLSEATLQPRGWKSFVEAFCSQAGVPHFVVAERSKDGQLILDDAPWEHDLVKGYDGETGLTAYCDYYQPLDGWDGFELKYNRPEPVLVSRQEGSTLGVSSEFWEWLNPLGISENAYAKLYETKEGWVGINLHFDGKIADPQKVLDALAFVQKPLGRSLQIQQAGFIQQFQHSLEQQLSNSIYPQMVIDASGSKVELNAPFEDLIRNQPDMIRVHGHLTFQHGDIQRAYRKAVLGLFKTRLPQVVTVPCSLMDQYLTVIIAPYEQAGQAVLGNRLYALITIVTDEHHAPLIRPFAKAHGLTPGQATILIELDKGHGPSRIAQNLNLSHDHIRKSLSQIYTVLGVCDLPSLLALLAKIHRSVL